MCDVDSLGIHLPQCLEKWFAEEAQRPIADQRPAPLPPPELADPEDPHRIRSFKHGVEEGILPSRREDIEAFNRRMYALWDTASLCPCPNCGRAFSWQAFERHKALCTAESPMKGLTGRKIPDTTCESSKGLSVTLPARPKR